MTNATTAPPAPQRITPRMGPASRALHTLGYVPADNLGALVDSHPHPLGEPTKGMAVLWDELAQVMRDRDEPWRAEAACADTPTAAFFSEGTPGQRGARTLTARRVAEELCATCPVREACGMYADAHHLEGVYGGRYRGQPGHQRRKLHAKAGPSGITYTIHLEVTP